MKNNKLNEKEIKLHIPIVGNRRIPRWKGKPKKIDTSKLLKKYKKDNNLDKSMDKVQKEFWKILNFFANHTKEEALNIKERNIKRYRRHSPEVLETQLSSDPFKWLDFDSSTKYIITQKGIEGKRDLDHIYSTDTAVLVSRTAIVISIISLLIIIF